MRRIVVLANCGSGAGAKEEERRSEILQAFAKTGVEPDIRCVLGTALAQAAKQALGEAPDVIVAAGGDGTVSAVAGVLAGTRTPLAVLPLGTMNHFARDAGIPSGLDEAADVAVSGVVGHVDVAEVNGHVFVNNSSIGIYPNAVGERRRMQSQGEEKRKAMWKAAWVVLRRLPAHRVHLSIDGRPIVRTTSFVFVGNNSYETGLGTLGTRASLSAGRLGVYHVRRPGRRHVLGLAARALVGRLDRARYFEAEEATELVIHSNRPEMRVALDGEVRRLTMPLHYRIRPRELLLMRPEA